MGLGVGKWGAILEFRREKKHSCRERVGGRETERVRGEMRGTVFFLFFFFCGLLN